MIKVTFPFLLFLSLISCSYAASVAQIYPLTSNLSDASVSWVGAVEGKSVYMSAEEGLTLGSTVYVSVLSGDLWIATMKQFDMELNLLEYQLVQLAENSVLKEFHALRSKNFLKAFKNQTDIVASSLPLAQDRPENFLVSIDNFRVGNTEVLLHATKKKSHIELSITYNGDQLIKFWSLELESIPKLLFWRPERAQIKSDVPRSKFKYHHKVLFGGVKSGEAVVIPLDIYSIEQDFYVWSIKIKTPEHEFKKQFKIRFQ